MVNRHKLEHFDVKKTKGSKQLPQEFDNHLEDNKRTLSRIILHCSKPIPALTTFQFWFIL